MKQLQRYLRNLVKGQHSVKSLTSVSSMLQNVPGLPLTFSCTTPATGQCSNFNTIQRASQRLQSLVIFYPTASPSYGGGPGCTAEPRWLSNNAQDVQRHVCFWHHKNLLTSPNVQKKGFAFKETLPCLSTHLLLLQWLTLTHTIFRNFRPDQVHFYFISMDPLLHKCKHTIKTQSHQEAR